tara:strand:+ start:820 stop:1254 length:435 start_codon:yes stop_codon:yes gene_type:complete
MGMAALGAVKAGIAMGKDLQSLGKDLGRVWDAIDQVNTKHTQASKGKGGTSSRALDTYIATVQARDMEDQLKRLVMETRGNSGWKELQKIREQVMKEDREGRAEAIRRKNQREYYLSIVLGIVLIGLGVYGLVYFGLYLKETTN